MALARGHRTPGEGSPNVVGRTEEPVPTGGTHIQSPAMSAAEEETETWDVTAANAALAVSMRASCVGWHWVALRPRRLTGA